MFVQCVVASEVIRISQGAPCRGATLRDVLTYTLSLLGVALSFWSGTVRRGQAHRGGSSFKGHEGPLMISLT